MTTQPLLLRRRVLLVAASLSASLLSVCAQTKKPVVVREPQDTFPVPAMPNQLFYLQRTANTNTVVYEANIAANGRLDEEDPVRVYWIRYPEGGQKKDLNFIQRSFAYGIKTKQVSQDVYNTHVVSYKKANIVVKRSPKDFRFHAYATINKKEILLTRIFVKIDGGSFWSPNVVYIEMKGKDEMTGEEVMERFKPSQTP